MRLPKLGPAQLPRFGGMYFFSYPKFEPNREILNKMPGGQQDRYGHWWESKDPNTGQTKTNLLLSLSDQGDANPAVRHETLRQAALGLPGTTAKVDVQNALIRVAAGMPMQRIFPVDLDLSSVIPLSEAEKQRLTELKDKTIISLRGLMAKR